MKRLMTVCVMMMCGCLFAAKGSSEERIAVLEEIYEARVRDAQDGLITNSLPSVLQTAWIETNGTMRASKFGITWERSIDGYEHQVED